MATTAEWATAYARQADADLTTFRSTQGETSKASTRTPSLSKPKFGKVGPSGGTVPTAPHDRRSRHAHRKARQKALSARAGHSGEGRCRFFPGEPAHATWDAVDDRPVQVVQHQRG